MEKHFGIAEAREKFGNLIEQVQYEGGIVIINRHGKPAAAMVPIEVYETWKNQRRAFFDQLRQMQETAALSPMEAERLAGDAVLALRDEDRPAE